jgi:hypothetical protein
MSQKRSIPEWVSRGKTIRQLIDELKSFENQELEVRLSLDYGDTHCPISIIGKHDGFCVLMNAETYYNGPWDEFITKHSKPKAKKVSKKKKQTK